jgi:hypothetical protein
MAVNYNRPVSVLAAEFNARLDALVPVISLAPTAQSAVEGDSGTTNINFPVSRTAALTRLDQVDYQVTPSGLNPASASDFVGNVFPSGSIIFGINVISKNIIIPIQPDVGAELTEGFTVTISVPGICVLGNAAATGEITNDDLVAPSLSISQAQVIGEGNSGTTALAWTLTLTRNGSSASYAYSWAITGTADAADFGGTLPAGSGTFAPGETSKSIIALVSGDTFVEPDEGVTLTVTAAGLNTVVTSGTITNDDTGPTLAQLGSYWSAMI